MMWELAGQILVLVGAAIFVAASVGVVRFTDAYTRISVVATAAGLGVAFLVAGAALLNPTLPTLVKAAIAIVLQLLTSTVGGIAIARAAVVSGHRFGSHTDPGELRDVPAAD